MAGRGFRKDSNDEILSEINIIPLVDISLVLLIIFMVTANYIMTPSFAVDIPQATHAKETAQDNGMVTITVSHAGPIYLDNQLVTRKELKDKIESQHKSNPDIAVVLSVDKNVNFKNVVDILDLLSELGISKLNIAATSE